MKKNNILEDLKTALDDLKGSVEKELKDVRKQKDIMQDMMSELFETSQGIHYLRDSNTLVLSAPNIVIGNVDPNGNLLPQSDAVVTIRANRLALEATGSEADGGSIISRAASIQHIAVDPGRDGKENVVCTNRSEVISQAHSISICSSTDKASFVSSASSAASGVFVTSESTIQIDALPSAKAKKEKVDGQMSDLSSHINDLKTRVNEQKTAIEGILRDIQGPVQAQANYNEDDIDIAVFYSEMRELQRKFADAKNGLNAALKAYVSTISELAECNRRKKALDEIKSDAGSKAGSFKTDPTGGSISMSTESFIMNSVDGDGNVRENEDAKLEIKVPHISITAEDAKGALIKDSSFKIQTQDFALSTANAKPDEERKNGDYPATGSVKITTKEVLVQAIDEELKDKKFEEKALTAGGKITLRAESIAALATDKEGKSTGSLNLDAKKMMLAAMDVDPQTLEAKEMAAGSQLNIQAEKTFVGTTEKAKLVQLASEKVGIMAKDTAEMQQDGKAVVTLSGGNLDAGGSAVTLAGDTTIKGNADIKGETKSPKGTFDQVGASKAFKSPNISDIQSAGTPGSAEKPSAKMTEEAPL